MSPIESLDLLIKQIEEIEVVGLYQDKDHIVELSNKGDIFFVRLDGANIYAGNDAAQAAATFYHQIAQIHDDTKKDSDPQFAALREILQSRNAHVKESLARIGHEALAGSLDGLDFSKDFTEDSLYNLIKEKMTNLEVLSFANYRPADQEYIECHTCLFFSAGGFCTKLDLPVKEEMVCDLFKALPMAEKNEEWAEVSHQPWEEEEHGGEHGHEHIESVQKDIRNLIYTEQKPLEAPANHVKDDRKPNIVMREFVPFGAEEGFQIFAKNDNDEGIEIQLIKSHGQWNIFTKQRDYSDLGDPFQSVGEAYQPRKVKNSGNGVEKVGPLARLAVGALLDEGLGEAFDKESDLGGLGVDDPEAPNIGLMQHHRRQREEEENAKSSLTTKAYPFTVGRPEEMQKPISAKRDEDDENAPASEEALSSAEAGTGTQAFSSGAVIDVPPEETDGVNINTQATGGAGSKGVEGGGDGSSVPIAHYPTPETASDYDSNMNLIERTPKGKSIDKEGGASGGTGGGFGGDGGGGTAMTAGGSSGSDATHTATHGGRTGRERRYDSSLTPIEKAAEDHGTFEGISQLPAPAFPEENIRKPHKIERHKPGDSEEDISRATQQELEIPREQQPLGPGYASSYVIADDNEYSPAELSENPKHEIVRRKFIDEDNRLRSVNDPAAEQYTNLSLLSQDLQPHFLKSTDTVDTLRNNDAFCILTTDSLQKMDLGRTLIVAGWGNYYIIDREGHRLSLDGMRRAMDSFLKRQEFANMNIFHSGIQVGKIIKKFVDERGKEWRTEVRPEGLFVVAAFRTDLEVSRRAMAEVLKGNMRGFSIAGNAKQKEIVCDHGKCWTEVTDLEIYEVTLCVMPMNPKSYITDIVQKPDPITCPECYENVELQYDSALRSTI